MVDLVIAEKPSVAQAIGKALGVTNKKDGYLEGEHFIISWCVGHLIELAEPGAYDDIYEKWDKKDLPIVPGREDMKWKYQVSEGTKKQFGILKELLLREDISSVINACDAGREGELIFRLVYEKCNCRKPIKRLWISSMEDEAIKNGFANLQNGSKYEALYESALCRERADWIVGINATRLFSILYGQTLNVGRVMTPTLALVVERDAAIKGFKPKTFYTLSLICEGITLVSDRFDSTDEVRKLAEICHAEGTVKIQNVEKKDKKEKAPALFDLTNLQREANRKLGYTAQQTLDYTQSLYEKKLVTYPRTDSRYLTEDMEETLPGLLSKIQKVFNMNSTEKQNLHAVINGKKVTDHHAIIPTASIDKAELTELPMGEQEILKLIVMRLLESVSSSFLYSETVVEGISGGQVFRAKGKQIIDKGWKQIEPAGKDEKAADECFDLKLEMGDEIKIQSLDYKEGQTTPPKSFTEDTLLSAMEKAGAEDIPEEAERKGLGTPATRAGIIEKLARVGFIERKGSQKTKYLIPTHKGEP